LISKRLVKLNHKELQPHIEKIVKKIQKKLISSHTKKAIRNNVKLVLKNIAKKNINEGKNTITNKHIKKIVKKVSKHSIAPQIATNLPDLIGLRTEKAIAKIQPILDSLYARHIIKKIAMVIVEPQVKKVLKQSPHRIISSVKKIENTKRDAALSIVSLKHLNKKH
jgi:hypothetical protein